MYESGHPTTYMFLKLEKKKLKKKKNDDDTDDDDELTHNSTYVSCLTTNAKYSARIFNTYNKNKSTKQESDITRTQNRSSFIYPSKNNL